MKKTNVIQPGGDKRTKHLYHGTLGAVLLSVIVLIKKYNKKIDWLVVIPYTLIAVGASWFWQKLHQSYPPDIALGVSGWMFHANHLITKVLFLGGTFEDTCIFHPFGMLMGILLAVYVFKIFKPSAKKRSVLKAITFSVIGLSLLGAAIFLDISSRYSFLIFALPGFIGILYVWKHINIINFIKWFPSMIALTIIWEFVCLVIPDLLYGHDAMCWFYKLKDGTHSLLYNPRLWITGRMPVAIDIIYPGSGMIFLTGLFGYLAKLRGWFGK